MSADEVVCGCGHMARIHDEYGCLHTGCGCDMPDEVTGVAS